MPKVEVNWKSSLLICVTASLFCSYQFLLQGTPSLIVPELINSFGLSMTEVGHLSSFFFYSYMILQVPSGVIADRVNLRFLLVVCCVLLGLCCYWFSCAESFFSAGMARVMMGIVTAPAIVIAFILASRWFPLAWFPVAAGIIETITVAGGVLGTSIIPKLMQIMDWREIFQYLAVIGFILALMCFCFVRHSPMVAQEGHQHKKLALMPCLLKLFKKKDFWFCCIYSFGMFAVLVCFGGLWGVPFLSECYPDHPEHGSNIIILIFVGAAIGISVMGLLGVILGCYRLLMQLCAFTCLMLFMLAIYYPLSLWSMGVLIFLVGFCSGGYLLSFTLVKQIAGVGNEGVAIAAINMFTLLAGPIIQPLVGKILQTGCELREYEAMIVSYQSALLPIILIQLMSLIVTFFISSISTKTATHSANL